MPVGRREVVDIAGPRQVDQLGVLQRPVRRQPPDDGPVVHHSKVPDAPVRLDPRVGQEGHGRQVAPVGDEAAGGQGLGIHGQGRAALPQGPDGVADRQGRGVGRIGVVGRFDDRARVAQGAETRHQHGAGRRLLAPLGRVGEPGCQLDLAVADAEPAHQPVAVEPVGRGAAGATEPGRPVAEQVAGQVGRRAPVHQPHRSRRHVGLHVRGRQAPVGAEPRGPSGPAGLGGDDRRRQGGGAGEEASARRYHGSLRP